MIHETVNERVEVEVSGHKLVLRPLSPREVRAVHRSVRPLSAYVSVILDSISVDATVSDLSDEQYAAWAIKEEFSFNMLCGFLSKSLVSFDNEDVPANTKDIDTYLAHKVGLNESLTIISACDTHLSSLIGLSAEKKS